MFQNANQNGNRRTKKIPIEYSKVAVYWRISLYFLSAAMMGNALAEVSESITGEGLGNVGMALIFAGLAFRSKEAAILAYVHDPKMRDIAMRKTRLAELANQPYVTWIMRSGWILLSIGLGMEVATWF